MYSPTVGSTEVVRSYTPAAGDAASKDRFTSTKNLWKEQSILFPHSAHTVLVLADSFVHPLGDHFGGFLSG